MSEHPVAPELPRATATTGIGSLPHTQLELALQLALATDIPYFPQLPRKNPAELMVAQGLEGLPGLHPESTGSIRLEVASWRRGAFELQARLEEALQHGRFADFEPSAAFTSAWQPFLWEVEARRLPWAKAQIVGPIAACQAVRLDDGRRASAEPGVTSQIFRLLLVRALAMTRALRERGATPLVFLDEPGALRIQPDVRVVDEMMLSEVRLLIAALRHEGARVGLHCCGNAAWEPLLMLGLDVLSFDARLSLDSLLSVGAPLDDYLARGGRLGLGIVPTERTPPEETSTLVERVVEKLRHRLGARTREAIEGALLTPACGLALRTADESEHIFERLRAAQTALQRACQEA